MIVYDFAAIYNIIRCRAETALQTERNVHLFYVNLKEIQVIDVIICNLFCIFERVKSLILLCQIINEIYVELLMRANQIIV